MRASNAYNEAVTSVSFAAGCSQVVLWPRCCVLLAACLYAQDFPTELEEQQMREAKVPALLNRAAVYLKLAEDPTAPFKAVADCEQVLKIDAHNPKALMRIGQAHVNRSGA